MLAQVISCLFQDVMKVPEQKRDLMVGSSQPPSEHVMLKMDPGVPAVETCAQLMDAKQARERTSKEQEVPG